MTRTPTPIQDLLRLAGKTAIVTGGAVGIGYGIAYRLAEAGANVVVADLDGEAAEDAAKNLKRQGSKPLLPGPTCPRRATWNEWSQHRLSSMATSTSW